MKSAMSGRRAGEWRTCEGVGGTVAEAEHETGCASSAGLRRSKRAPSQPRTEVNCSRTSRMVIFSETSSCRSIWMRRLTSSSSADDRCQLPFAAVGKLGMSTKTPRTATTIVSTPNCAVSCVGRAPPTHPEEDALPALERADAVDAKGIGQQLKHASAEEEAAEVEGREALGELVTRVPRGDEQQGGREEDALGRAEQDAQARERDPVLGRSLDHCRGQRGSEGGDGLVTAPKANVAPPNHTAGEQPERLKRKFCDVSEAPRDRRSARQGPRAGSS